MLFLFPLQGGRESLFTSVAAGSFIRDSTFSKAASPNCGPIEIVSTSSQFLIERTTLTDSVSNLGGGICVVDSSVLVRNLLCTKNIVSSSGGCIWSQGFTSMVAVEDSDFSFNMGIGTQPTYRGGAIGVENAVSCSISGSTFLYNGGPATGGALGVAGTVSFVSVTNSSFVGNNALTYGGAIAVYDTSMTITASTFDGNFLHAQAETNFGSHVGKLGVGPLLVSDSTFRNGYYMPSPLNRGFGGLVCYLCTATVTRCFFENNLAPIGPSYYALASPSSTIVACVFRNNTSQYGSGVLSESSPTLAISDSLFEDNIATWQNITGANLIAAGGLMTYASDSVTVQNCTFRRNGCRGTGGARGCATHFVGLNTAITIDGCLFDANFILNAPNSAGSAIDVEQNTDGRSTLTLTRSIIRNNYMKNPPASLSVDFTLGTVFLYVPVGITSHNVYLSGSITDCLFMNNTALIGPGFGTQDANATIRNCTFVDNIATVSAGCVYAITLAYPLSFTTTTLDIANTTFANNTVLPHPIVDLGYRVSDLYLIATQPQARRPQVILGEGISWSKPPSSWYLDASISLGGADAFFNVTPGQVVRLPRVFSLGSSQFDFSNSDVYAEGCLFWWSLEQYLKNVPTTILLNQHNLYCNVTSLRHYKFVGTGMGKVFLTGVTDMSAGSGRDGTFQIASNVDIVNRGLFWLYNSTLDLQQGANFTNDATGFMHAFLFDAPALLRGNSSPRSSLKNFGWLRLSTLILDNVDLIFFPNSTLRYDLTNYWLDSRLVLRNSSKITLDGTLRLNSNPMRVYSEPTRSTEYTIIDSEGAANAISGSWASMESTGGYDYDVNFTSSLDQMRAAVVAYYPLQGQRTSDGLGFQVTFPRPVNTSNTNCADIFDAFSMNLLSASPICNWRDTSTLLVRSTRIPPSVFVRPGAILDETDPQMSVSRTLNITILRETSTVAPVVVLSGPATLPSCADLVIDAKNSYNLGILDQVTFDWSLVSPNLPSLASIVSAARGPVLQIPGASLPVGSTYTFKLNITNNLSKSGSTLFNATSISSNKPIVFVEGPSVRTPLVLESLQLNARVEVPSCILSPTAIERIWTLVSGPALSKPLTGTNQFSLFIPGGSMIANQTYTFEFRAWDPETDSFATAVSQRVRVIPQASALLMLSTGPSGLVPSNQALNLTVAVLDPDRSFATVPSVLLRFRWQLLACPGRFDGSTSVGQISANFLYQNLVPSATSYSATVTQISLANTTASALAVCSDQAGNSVTVYPSAISSLSLSSSRLPVGLYVFGVSALSADGRLSSQLVSVTVTNATVSRLVQFSSPKFSTRRILSHEKFSVTANVPDRASLPSDIVGRWKDSADSGILTAPSASYQVFSIGFFRHSNILKQI
jgi:hypothetical protein